VIVYISGILTKGGTLGPEEIAVNRQRFADAEELLVELGHTVLNPLRHEGKAEGWAGYMRLGIVDVLAAESICMLPGWEDSPGAILEHTLAVTLGLVVIQIWPVVR
jgi:hypothetical protein